MFSRNPVCCTSVRKPWSGKVYNRKFPHMGIHFSIAITIQPLKLSRVYIEDNTMRYSS
jgi:hypothetical protein